jgi:hypothetical protein
MEQLFWNQFGASMNVLPWGLLTISVMCLNLGAILGFSIVLMDKYYGTVNKVISLLKRNDDDAVADAELYFSCIVDNIREQVEARQAGEELAKIAAEEARLEAERIAAEAEAKAKAKAEAKAAKKAARKEAAEKFVKEASQWLTDRADDLGDFIEVAEVGVLTAWAAVVLKFEDVTGITAKKERIARIAALEAEVTKLNQIVKVLKTGNHKMVESVVLVEKNLDLLHAEAKIWQDYSFNPLLKLVTEMVVVERMTRPMVEDILSSREWKKEQLIAMMNVLEIKVNRKERKAVMAKAIAEHAFENFARA